MDKHPSGGDDEALASVITDATQRYTRWHLPSFDSGVDVASAEPLTAQQLEEIEAAAYQEGRARGYEDGLCAGREEMQKQAARLRALIEQIARPLAQLDDEVERALVDLSCAVARRLLGDELRAAPERVLALAQQALAALPADLRELRLFLHPEDAALVRGQLLPPPEVAEFRVLDDPALARGDCRVHSESAYLDARLDTRLALLAGVLGEHEG